MISKAEADSNLCNEICHFQYKAKWKKMKTWTRREEITTSPADTKDINQAKHTESSTSIQDILGSVPQGR